VSVRIWDKSRLPTGPFALNLDCPQAQGLVAWYPMGGATSRNYAADLAGKKHASGTSTAATFDPIGAPALSFTAASSDGLGSVESPTLSYPLTIAAWFRPRTAHSGTVAALASNTGASGTGRKLLYCHSDGSIRLYNQEDSGVSTFPATSGSYTAGQIVHGAAVFAGGADFIVYRNAGNVGTSTTSVSFGTPDRIRIGDDNTGGNFFNGDVGEVGFWLAALSVDTLKRINDPGTKYELWYPLRSRKWFSAPSAGVPSITAVYADSVGTDRATPRVTLDYA
jgi:hypothetical protein